MPLKFYLITLTLLTFLAFGWDKRLAKNGKRRIAESALLLLTFMGGTFGAMVGMTFFRNKNAKKMFIVKLVLVIVVQLALIFFLKEHLTDQR